MSPKSSFLGWDTGPSLLLLPKKYEDAYKRLGSDIKTELNLKRAAAIETKKAELKALRWSRRIALPLGIRPSWTSNTTLCALNL